MIDIVIRQWLDNDNYSNHIISPVWWRNFDEYHSQIWDKISDKISWIDYLNNLTEGFISFRNGSYIFSFESEEDATAFILKWS